MEYQITYKTMNETAKRYILSTLITFAAGFALVVVPEIDSLTIEALSDGGLVGLLFAGVRAGIKALLEWFLAWYANR